MAAQYPTRHTEYERQRFDDPSYYDQSQSLDDMNRPIPHDEYGFDPSLDSYPSDEHSYYNHSHHHHHHHHQPLQSLTIRRHRPGSDDPTLQKFPINLQPSSDNITSSSKLNVSIKRNPVIPEQPVIQPIIYPVPVYMEPPVQQYPMYQPVQPIIEYIKPPSPIKAIEPVRKSPSPPPSRNTNNTPLNRRAVRLDLYTPPPPPPPPPIIKPERTRSSAAIVEEYAVPKKVISYRTVPGMTTRELENYDMDNSQGPVYIKSPKNQTVTYRVS